MVKISIRKEKLKEYMIKNNLTQKDFANIIGVDHTMVCRVMREERNPGSKFVAGILKNTEFQFEDIFFTSDLSGGRKAIS